jgi:hypothetical protein
LCFDARQAAILKHLLCEDTDYPRHRLANCQASMGANIRWTMTVFNNIGGLVTQFLHYLVDILGVFPPGKHGPIARNLSKRYSKHFPLKQRLMIPSVLRAPLYC